MCRRRRASGAALGLAAFFAFVVRTPLKVVLVDRWRHRWLPRTGLAAELFEVARRFDELRGELEPHLAEEERVVFPLIRHLVTSDTAPLLLRRSRGHPLARLLAEHDRIGELFVDLRWLTDAYQTPPDGCASYQACYAGLAELEAAHLHVHKRNNVLFPAVERLAEQLAGDPT